MVAADASLPLSMTRQRQFVIDMLYPWEHTCHGSATLCPRHWL